MPRETRPNPTAPTIVVIGSSNTDIVIRCAELPRPGQTVRDGTLATYDGGKGANQAVAAARAGAKVHFVGARGPDANGQRALRALAREGINTRHFRTLQKAPSGTALIFVSGRTGENAIAVAKSANDRLTPAMVAAAEPAIRRADAILLQFEVPMESVIAAARLARRHGVPVILNPAPIADLPARLIPSIDYLTPNEHEARALTGERDPRRAAKRLLARGIKHVAVTLGAHGVLLADADGLRMVPARKIKAVDTVGAGDCFNGWLAVGIARGLSFDRAAQVAVFAAGLAVSRPGAQPGMPHANEVIL